MSAFLMDRFGTRRVTLFFVWTAIGVGAGLSAGAVVLAVAAAADRQWRRAVLCLVGLADLDCATAEGEAEYIGRFSFFARIGTTVAPILVGVAWDFGGVWPSYLLGFAWGIVLTMALLRAPEADRAPRDGAPRRPRSSACATRCRACPITSLLRADGDPGGGDDNGDHLSAHRHQSGVQFSLYVVYLTASASPARRSASCSRRSR